MNLDLSKAQEIQFMFPTEPDWSSVEKEVLIELVDDYLSEPSCATSALYEISSRDPDRAKSLCNFLLNEKLEDKWLKNSTLGILLSLNFCDGYKYGIGVVEECDLDTLSVLLESLNYELQGEEREFVLQHEITKKMKARLSLENQNVEYSELFYKYIGEV